MGELFKTNISSIKILQGVTLTFPKMLDLEVVMFGAMSCGATVPPPGLLWL